MKIEAHSPEWYKARLEVFNGSCLYNLISEKKDKDLPRPYVLEKAGEIDTGIPQNSDFESEDMLHGSENEQLAVNWAAKTCGLTIEESSYFIRHPELLFGATADRYAYDSQGNKITCEIKCPKSKTHLRRCFYKDAEMLKKKEPKIYWQIVGGALVGGSTKGLFADFDPRVNPNFGLFVIRFDIPEYDFDTAISAIKKAEIELKEVLLKLNGADTQPLLTA